MEKQLQASQELRQRMELRLQAVQEERLRKLEETLARAREQVAEAEGSDREASAARLEQLERLLVESQAQAERAAIDQERAFSRQEEKLSRELAIQSERLARVGELRQLSEEAFAEYGERAEEARARAREQIQEAQQVVVRLRSRIRLGVSLDGAQGDDLDGQGARIQSIIDDSPAQEAGLLEGDIITHLNGQYLLDPIPNEGDEEANEDESLPVQRLMALAQDLEPGDEVEIRYLRDGQAQTASFQAADLDRPSITVLRGELGDLEGLFSLDPGRRGVWSFGVPDAESFEFDLQELKNLEDLKLELRDLYVDEPNVWFRSSPGGAVRGYALGGGEVPSLYSIFGTTAGFGLELTDLNPGLSEYFSSEEGLLVLDVAEDSTLGLLPGDVILSIDGRMVEDQGDVRRILGSYDEDETVSFTVMRKGQQMTVEGTIR